MGLTTEHRGGGPKVVVPGTGQFLNSTPLIVVPVIGLLLLRL